MADRKRLLLIVPTLHQGGQEHVVVRSAYLLASHYDVTIAIFDDSDIGYDVTGLDIVNLNVPASSGSIFKAVNIIRRRAKLAALKEKLHPDISYSYGPSANLINALTATESESTWVGLRNYTDITDVSRMNLCARKADLIVCCSRDIETVVRHRYEDTKSCVLYNLYDIEEIKSMAGAEEPDEELPETDTDGNRLYYLMSMGRDDDQKMFWHMLKTFKLINTVNPHTRLVIMGDGTFDRYRTMAEHLCIDEKVIFAGMQANPYRYLKYADINWMTSRNEGFPNALVEGMALGAAAVSTNCMTGPAEILTDGGDVFSTADELENCDAIYGEYGILTPALSRERNMDFADIGEENRALAHVILDLIDDADMLDRYKEAARERAKDYDYEHYLMQFMSLAGRMGIGDIKDE